MDISTALCIEMAEGAYTESRQQSSNARETITLFAEADCKMNEDIQHRNHVGIQETAETVELLAATLVDALRKIEQLENTIATLTK